eukprot:6682183-Pyramimonas_sp.AAC.1
MSTLPPASGARFSLARPAPANSTPAGAGNLAPLAIARNARRERVCERDPRSNSGPTAAVGTLSGTPSRSCC